MQPSRTAFLLSRLTGLSFAIESLIHVTYLPERIFDISQSRNIIYQHEEWLSVSFFAVRALTFMILAWFFWAKASRVARWLEGKIEPLESSDNEPPISHP